jgi:hypothetical protein
MTSTRWSGPMMSPDRERRVTVASSTRIESGKATGAPWWELNITPRATIQPEGEMLSASAGPTV